MPAAEIPDDRPPAPGESPVTAGARVTVERAGHVLLIGLNRPEKRNAADLRLITELSLAYGVLHRDPQLRVGLVFAHGDHFTAGLDLADIAPRIGPTGIELVPADGIDPWGLSGERQRKPVVVAVHGTCLTLGIELILAADVAVAADSTRFGQIEVSRGILPFGGATMRLPRAIGWGNAMRWILSGEHFAAVDAHRTGLVQEVVPHGEQYGRGLEIANRIAAQAPLAVQAALASARLAVTDGDAAASAVLQSTLVGLIATEDAAIGMRAFLAREDAVFVGR